jgi:poly(beta-D-mannuronate) lyase
VADGDVVELEPGVHVVTSKVVLSKSITFRPADKKAEKPVITMEVQRENASIFEIEGSPTVKFENIAIRGDMKARYPVKYAIVTSKEFATGYNLMIDNCEISDFNVNSGSVFNAYKGTIADTIRITNSDIRSCFRGLILSQEKDNVGKYSAECVYLENTSFSNITQYVVDYYRGGVDESTLGGHLYVNHCVFDLSAKEEKQYILRNNGIVNVTIKNSIFGRSQAKTPLRLTGPKHQILHCNFFECSDPKIEKGAISKGLMYENPRFEKKSYILSKKSRLKGKAEDGGDIGLK